MKVYTQLSIEERIIIYNLRQNGASLKIIGNIIKRNKSTIGRELKRNKYNESIPYLPDSADIATRERRNRLSFKLDRHDDLKKHVIQKLQDKWSPDVIAGVLKAEAATIRISAEAIYQYIYSDKGKALNMHTYLASKREKRNKFGRKSRKQIIQNKVSVHERPTEANNRLEVGHFEADLTFSKGNQSANILVITERKTRYTVLIKNDSKKATDIMQKLFNFFAQIPEHMRKSVTFDNGTEFTYHQLIKDFLKIATYFCDPHSPWQKGQVEKTNAMLHRFVPKNSDFLTLDEDYLLNIQNQFNNIPRKKLGYQTPTQLFNLSLQRVALQA